ncbi:MAG: ATP-binding cassette domain-containing protein, partial [Moritella sp.]
MTVIEKQKVATKQEQVAVQAVNKELLLEVNNLKVQFDIPSKSLWPWALPSKLKAVDGVSIKLYEGETLGVVGESGCGKSTFARALIGLVPAAAGNVV